LKPIPELKTQNMIVSVLRPEDINLLVTYESQNRDHLAKWEPNRSYGYFSLDETKKRVERNYKDFRVGSAVSLVGFNKEKSKILCVCTFSNITYSAFQACNLGYSISEQEQGKGLMFEMLQASINYVFKELNLHRIMANYIPENTRSERLLNRLGFQKEGLAKSYLKIAGSWQDHVLTSKINFI